MSILKYILFISTAMFVLGACNKEPNTPKGLSELEHHYYAIFVPNNNTAVTATRSQTALLKFPVQFYSTNTRTYDAVCKYAVTTFGITPPAVRGVDYNVVDKNGVTIPSSDSTYTLVFPKAIQAMDTIYLKMLNNTTPGARKFEVHILENITNEFTVDKFS
ncbi:MAG: hypothetical protein EOP51_25270, partial [Sphingobacteriales bacterium]